MVPTIEIIERERLTLQQTLDDQKTAADRNKLGQFSTPTALARDVVAHGLSHLPNDELIHFLDPALGTGAFYSALRAFCPDKQIREAVGFEIDPHYALPATGLWQKTNLRIVRADFTHQPADPRFNLIICNPPYVRHHHLPSNEKRRLQLMTRETAGIRLSGLAGLYCHFLGLAHGWMAPGAIAGWLIPSEFMDVNYGRELKRYLLNRVTLLRIHRFDPSDVQFADALVSSAIVWFRNSPPCQTSSQSRGILFTFGGTLAQPEVARQVSASDLIDEPKWTRYPQAAARVRMNTTLLGDLFTIKRGIATGSNNFFILTEEEVRAKQIPHQFLRPILPSPRYVPADLIDADDDGLPILAKRLFLIDARLDESDIQQRFPELWTYLSEGRARGVHEGYICRHRPRWYAQEERPPAPIVCTYLGRGSERNERPFRFIRNRSRATVANVYLAMYPRPALVRALASDPTLIDQLWSAMNKIELADILGEGRVYGGGLHKLEPKELANVPVTAITGELPDEVFHLTAEPNLFTQPLASLRASC